MPDATTRPPLHRLDPVRLAFAVAALILAYDPIRWLISTWRDPAYDTSGLYVFALAMGLFAWSMTSPRGGAGSRHHRLALVLIALSAGVRLAGQVLAVNMIGALCLVLDVYAIGLLLGTGRRARAVSPAWLAVVFAFSLPLERALQRTIGYVLQHASADGACGVLGLFYDGLSCHGVRIVLAGRDVLVDLPCSGARTLMLSLLAFSVCAALVRPTARQAAMGLALTLGAGFVANVARIVVLAIGIGEPHHLGGIDVMAAPWHDAIGLAALALAVAPVMWWMGRLGTTPRTHCRVSAIALAPLPDRIVRDGWWLKQPARKPAYGALGAGHRHIAFGLAAVAVAVAIVSLPRKPIDIARPEAPILLPATLDGMARHDLPLSGREQAFFRQYGGAAAKASYGPHSLLLVRTSSPLRHLHTPDDCLRGLGFAVQYLGTEFAPVPTAVYRAVSPEGDAYRVDVTFVSDRGETTSNVATAVWHWLNGKARRWTAVQRISPEAAGGNSHRNWSAAVLAALEIGSGRDLALQSPTEENL